MPAYDHPIVTQKIEEVLRDILEYQHVYCACTLTEENVKSASRRHLISSGKKRLRSLMNRILTKSVSTRV
jgi:hypothetical protein